MLSAPPSGHTQPIGIQVQFAELAMLLNEHMDDAVTGHKKGFPITITVNVKLTTQAIPK